MAGEDLKTLIAKMKAETSQTSVPIKKKQAKTDDEEIEAEYNEEEDGDEEEIETLKPVPKKPVQKAVPQETEEVSLADQIRNLHDNGIFRLELLGVLHQINNNLRIVAGVLTDYKK